MTENTEILVEDIEIPENEIDLFKETEPVVPTETPEDITFVNPPFIPAQ